MKWLMDRAKSVMFASATTIIGVIGFTASPTLAGTLHGDWYYTVDSFNDSMTGNIVGNTKYEIFSVAMKQTGNEVIMAINTHFGINGSSSQYANDGHVSWGDLLFNFTGQSLDTASNASQLFGVRFASNNESGVPELGVYSNVKAKAIANDNGLLLSDLNAYNSWISSHGGTPDIGDLSAYDPYFNPNHHIQNVIESGTKIGNVNILSDPSNLGLDFAHFGATGTQTLAISFDRDLLPDGNFLAHWGPECDNDVIAIAGELTPVPEPSTALALGAFSLLLGMTKIRRRQNRS